MTLLSARDLRLAFGATPALRGAHIDIDRGEVVALMGPSGSGKSTLLYCLAGILPPDTGAVVYDGVRLDDMPDRDRSRLRRREFGFVFQFGQLVPELTAADNVAMPLLLDGAARSDAYALADEWLERLEIAAVRTQRTGEMSGGQAQRVAVARALAPNPRVVFADEPTGALDSLSGERVMDALTEHARHAAATVVLVTHEPRVAAYAERRLIMRDGRVTTPVRSGSA
jgi:putative ABC transport system ATP-binding protein